MRKLPDQIWIRYNNLIIIENISLWRKREVKCKCDCWNIKIIKLCSLRNWITKSCWCLQIKKASKHWLYKHPLYKTWRWINTRCYNNNSIQYKDWGGRWITCEWKSIEEFIHDMYSTYRQWLQLDRINNDWNYSKNNCRWATRVEQSRNRRSNIIIDWITLIEYCHIHWKNYQKIICRMRKLNWSLEKSINT